MTPTNRSLVVRAGSVYLVTVPQLYLLHGEVTRGRRVSGGGACVPARLSLFVSVALLLQQTAGPAAFNPTADATIYRGYIHVSICRGVLFVCQVKSIELAALQV